MVRFRYMDTIEEGDEYTQNKNVWEMQIFPFFHSEIRFMVDDQIFLPVCEPNSFFWYQNDFLDFVFSFLGLDNSREMAIIHIALWSLMYGLIRMDIICGLI